jgi:membrane protein YqaA with SNARE-associated domain
MDWVRGLAFALGGPGLFVLAFLDSSFLSFPEVVDLLLVVMVTRHPERFLYYSTLATIGSIAGCYALYYVARRGGETFVRKRFHERHVDAAIARFQKYGLLAVAIPAILPPPVPLKLFVLAAGIANVRPLDFVLAIALGRGVRYYGEGLLALWYGEAALGWMRENATLVTVVLIVAVGLLGLAWTFRRRGRAAD